MRYSTAYATGFVHLCRAHAESPSVSGDASRLLGVTLGECTDSRHGRVCDLCDAETIGASPSAAMLDQIAQLGRHAVAQGLRVRVTAFGASGHGRRAKLLTVPRHDTTIRMDPILVRADRSREALASRSRRPDVVAAHQGVRPADAEVVEDLPLARVLALPAVGVVGDPAVHHPAVSAAARR